MHPALADKRLLIVTGKGGVGKTTIATALGLASAREGRRTLICEINAKERVTQLLGKPEAGPTVTSVDENLWCVNVRPHEALREYALMVLKFESIYSAVFENRVVQYFLRFVPSLQELVLLGKILFHLKEKRADGTNRFDRIIIDAPATGHAITFLSVPQVLLDTVPPGAMSADATWMRDFLVDPNVTAAVLVSLPEELPVNETLELNEALRNRVHVQPQLVVLNGAIAPRFTAEECASAQSPAVREVMLAHATRVQLSDSSKSTLLQLGLPLVEVPRVFSPEFGRAALEAVTSALGKNA